MNSNDDPTQPANGAGQGGWPPVPPADAPPPPQPPKRSWIARHKAVAIAAAVLVVIAAGTAVALASGDQNAADEAACQRAVTELMDKARAGDDLNNASKPPACNGLDQATLNRIMVSVTGKAFDDALADLNKSLAPTPTGSPTPEAPTYSATPQDFKIDLKIKSKECFGSAGCNVQYAPELTIVGAQVDQTSGSYEITYEVRGVEDGPSIDTIDVDGGQYQQIDGFAQTASRSTKLTAVITDVETS